MRIRKTKAEHVVMITYKMHISVRVLGPGAGMREIKITQTKNGGKNTIDIWFKSLDQLFDPSDPFPFPKKELTDQAEEAIFGHFIDLYLMKDNELILHIPRGSISKRDTSGMADAIRRHFSFRLDDLAQEKKSSWREGKVSVTLTIMNICIGITVFYLYYHSAETSFWVDLILGILIIINWVTIWDTYEYFLYDYRKLWRKYRVYKKLTQTHVTIMETVNETTTLFT